MFERFSNRARRVVVLAQEEARGLRHDYIGTEHLLLGLLHDEDGTAHRVLRQLRVTPDAVREKVAAHAPPGDTVADGHIPFTPSAKKALEKSLRESLQMGDNYIGSGHLLLGLLGAEDGTATRVLAELGVGIDRARSLVRLTPAELAEAEGSRGFGAPMFREMRDRLKGIEDRLVAIEERLAAIEERLEPPAAPRSL